MDPKRGMGGYFLIIPSSAETYLPFCPSKNVKEMPNLEKLCTVAGDPDNFCNFWTLSYAFHHSQLPHISFNNCQIVTSSFIAFFFSVKFLSKKTFNSSIYLLDANCKQSKKSDLGLITNTEAFVRFMLDIWFSDGLQTGFVQKGLVSKCNCCFNEKFWSVLENIVFDFFNSFV